MMIGKGASWVSLAAFTLMLPVLAQSQDAGTNRAAASEVKKASESKEQTPAKRAPAVPKSGASKSEPKPALTDVTRVSTVDATRSAAAQQAKKQVGKDAATGQAEDSAVLEFHPAEASQSGPAAATTAGKGSKKSVLKNVHGNVYGALDPKNPGNRGTAASVGTSSKSGKTSVYVETDQTRTTPPR